MEGSRGASADSGFILIEGSHALDPLHSVQSEAETQPDNEMDGAAVLSAEAVHSTARVEPTPTGLEAAEAIEDALANLEAEEAAFLTELAEFDTNDGGVGLFPSISSMLLFLDPIHHANSGYYSCAASRHKN